MIETVDSVEEIQEIVGSKDEIMIEEIEIMVVIGNVVSAVICFLFLFFYF